MAARQTLLALLFVTAAAGAAGHAAAAGKVPAGSTLCCTNTTGYHECVEACFSYYPREQAQKFCDPGCQEAYQCHAVPGEKCPSTSLHRRSFDDLPTDKGEAVQAATTSTTLCCSNMTGFHECVEGCFGYFPREQAEKICDPGCKEAYQCRTVSGDKCPSSVSGEVVQAVSTTTLCCSNMTGFHECVEGCFGYFPREQAEKICDPGCKEAYQCRTVSGDKCPTNSAVKEGAAVEKCMSGCKSSVCSKMVTGGVGSKLVAVKRAVDRCNNACNIFCTKGLRAGTASA